MYKSLVSDSTALNATETTEKLIDTLNAPGGVKSIVGFAGQFFGGAGITTLENVTGKWRIRNKSQGYENEFLCDAVVVLTSGVGVIKPTVWPCDMPVSQGDEIEGYAVLDLAQTVNNSARFMLIFE